MKKRILSFLLALLMVVSIMPMPTYAEGSADVTVTPTEAATETTAAAVSETPCGTCGQLGCTSEHLTWCTDCKMDDCGKTHVYCETCQKNDCGVDHNATEPTEAATDPVVAINEGDEEETDPMVGKQVKIASGTSMAWPLTDITNGTTIIASISEYAEVMVVMAVGTVNGTTYYQLRAADGYSWPENSKVQDGYWLDSSKLEVIEEKESCPICGNTDCTTEHKQCEICEEYDCIKIHFWCERCEDYDCGKSHLICPACGDVDCEKPHTWCSYCAGYDCGMEHEDEYRPDTAPVIPANPTLTPGADVSLVDEYGDPVTDEGFMLIEGMKSSLSAWTDLEGDISYQWQVCYNNANSLWVDIAGETGQGILVSPAMFLSIIDYQAVTYLRCVTTNGSETRISHAIPLTVEEMIPQQSVALFATLSGDGGEENVPVTTADDGVNYAIIIEYKFQNGDTAAQAYTAHLSAGQDYILDVESPAVVGYKPDRERITETITNISGPLTYTVTYQPDYVDYKVIHHQQNIGDNDYTAVKTETMTGLTGSPVGTGLEESYDGFYDLVYDSGITIAADGSTVINIYYDRYYYLVSLDLNGGYGVEPIYARYGTPINSAAWIPQRTGYSFAGWSPTLPSAVPIGGSSHTAQWTKADTGFTVAFWYENANDEEYTFVGSVQQTAVTGTKVNGADYKDAAFDGRDDEHFTYEKADTNVEIAADGSSVVNVYFSRNTYTLSYYEFVCPHIRYSQHTSACCSLTTHAYSSACNTSNCSVGYAHTHGSGCQYCSQGRVQHTHSHDACCTSNWLPEWMHSCQYASCDYGYQHTHSSSCCTLTVHSHSSACCSISPHGHGHVCNTSACTHNVGYWQCPCLSDASVKNNPDNWVLAKDASGNNATYTFKYEQDVSAVHAAQGAERWCPGIGSGFSSEGDYGNSLAVGTFSSMHGCDVTFYRGSPGSTQYYFTYWLETYDGSGSRDYNGRNFAQGTTFTPKMGAVGYKGDYQAGRPVGFADFEAWSSDSLGGSNVAQLVAPNGSFGGDTYIYYNFYYIRTTHTLSYFNGSEVVATRTMKYDEPLTSTYNLQNLSMTSPYGSGYYFAGWYLDADCTVPVSWGSTRMPDGGMAVYAKWAPLTHTVTTYQTNGGTKLGEYTVTHGDTVDNAPADPTRDGYNFVSWFYEEDGTVKAYNFSMPVYKDLTLYAEWTSDSLASGTITYVDEATGQAIAEPTPITGLVGASKTYSAKTGTELNSGYQTGYFPAVSSHNIEFSPTTSQNNWIFYYTKMDDVAYTVRYVNKDTGEELETATTGTSNAGKITVPHVTIPGYAADAYSKDLVLSSDPALNVVTFYYTKDDVHAPVQVEHYIQNTTGTGYTHYFTEQPYNGNIGDTQTATPLTLTGFTYNKSGNSINGVELTASGLVLKLYYDRNTYNYTFRFMVEGTTTELRAAVTGSGLYGAQVSQVAPTIPGYDLTTSGSLTITIGTNADDNVRTFYYEEDTVTIQYQVGSVKGGIVDPASETVLAVTGDPDGSTATANENYVFKGWYTTYACNGTAVSTDADFEPSKNSDGVYETKTYYAKFEEAKATINYAVEMPEDAEVAATLTETSEQVSVLSGEAVGSAVADIPNGYEFAGWYDTDGNKVGDSESFVPTMTGDKWVDGTTYTAKFVEQKATINYVAVGKGTVSPATEEVDMVTGIASGAAATTAENISAFIGWYDNEACTGTALSTDTSFKPDTPAGGWAETQTYYAKFENIEYTIRFDTNGGTPTTIDPISYAYGDTLTLPTVENGNYIVTWTVKENAGSWVKDSEVKNGTINHYGNVTLVANWTIDAVWIDWDFNILTSDEADILYSQPNIPYGTSPVYAGDLTTDALAARRNDAQYTYTFKEWVEEDLSTYDTTGIIVYRASYEETVNKYTVTWQNEDGTTIDTTEVEYGTIPTHADPSKAATAEFTYTFAGWTPEVVAVTEDATYKATFTETKRSYTITWLNDDDSVIDTTSVAYGEVPTHADPSKAATAEYTYTFAGWSPEVVAVTGEATYKATYTAEKNKYTIIWKNEDGTVLETDTDVEYGVTPSYGGAEPTKAPENQYTYTFRAWSPEIVPVTGDAVYIASYDPHENAYTVTWVNHDGTVLETDENVAWDTMPEYNGDTPEKVGNAEHSYSFAGWSPTVSKVNGHATYTATFTESVNTYTVTWKNEDGTVLETDEDVVYGAMPNYDGETPEKAATAQYTYAFDGWDKEIVTVTGDVTYTAKFSATVNKYTVTFVDEDGTTILKEATEYEYGTAAENIVKPADPTKKATAEHTYTFTGWAPEIAEVTANVTYKATYTEVKNQYTLSGEIDHGTVTGPVTVDYDTNAKITFTPAVGYKFDSWKVNDGSATSITTSDETWSYEELQLTENKHVVVTMAPIEYTITYDLRDGEMGEGITNPVTYTVETDSFTLHNPTRAGYKFKGWAISESSTTGTEIYTIEKGTTGNKTFYAVWERSLVDLTITTTSADQEQSFIFTVSGTPSDSSYGTITLDVVLIGTDSITIKDLPVGEYTVTEKDGWSWRENAVESETANLRTTSQTVSFDFGNVDDLHWLSGYSYKRRKGGS